MFRVLDGVAVDANGGAVPLPTQLQRLLGILLAEREHPVSTDVIVDRLWEPPAPKTAVKTVQVLVGRLRRLLAPEGGDHFIATAGHGYCLAGAPVDIDDYLRYAEQAERDAIDDPAAALRATEEALIRWTGRPWGDQAEEAWLSPTVEMLEERHRRTEELWADLVLQCNGSDLPVERLRAAAMAEPLRERRWARLMIGLYRTGRQADALRAYDEARLLLRDELGVDPGPELRQLQLRVLQHDPSLRASSSADSATSTTFVGRDTDMRRLADALARSRMVIVVGLGGIGKSRLAAEHVHRRRLDGARTRWAGLGGLSQAARVPEHVAAAVGIDVEDAPSAMNAVAASIGHEATLLVLDGAEIAASEVAGLALHLIEKCPRLRVLVTSRVPIGLTGSRLVELGPLELPTADAPVRGTALELLVDRLSLDAAALDMSTRERLAALCQASGGVPLLVELLAANVDVTGRDQVWVADDALRSHYDVVRDAIDHALDAIDEQPRRLVRAMAALPAGASEQSAAALLGVPDDVARRALRLLAWTHLVDAQVGRATLRYRSLDPVREALLAELDERERAAGLERATAVMTDALRALRSPGLPVRVSALDGIDDEHDNLRFLLGDRLHRAPVEALTLAIPACEFWPFRGHILEGCRWLELCIDAARPEGELRWRAVIALARTTRTFGEVAKLLDSLEDVVDEMRTYGNDEQLLGTGLMYLAMARGWRADRAGANAAVDEAEQINRRVGTPWTAAHIQQLRDLDRALVGDLDGAREGMRQFGRTLEALDDPIGAAMGWYLAATMGDMAGQTDLRDDINRARQLAESHHDSSLLNQLIRIEARLLQRTGDPDGRRLLETAAERLTESGGLRAAALARLDIALLDIDRGDAAAATDQLRRALPALVYLDREGAALGTVALATLAAGNDDENVARRLVADAQAFDEDEHPSVPTDRSRLQKLLHDLPQPSETAVSTDEATADVLAILDTFG